VKAVCTNVVDIDSDDEANQPEDHEEEGERVERDERLRHDRRHAGRQPDDQFPVGEELLHVNGDDRHEDRREQALRAQVVHHERRPGHVELNQQERDHRHRCADDRVLLQPLPEVIRNRDTLDDGQ
jgi:hypothetical protein